MNIRTKQTIRLFSGFIVLLFLGTTLAWSVFLVPVETTFGWSRGQTSLAATVNTMAFSVGSILTGIMCKKISFSNILRITGIMLFIGFFLASLMQPGCSIIMLYITYGLLIGTAIGMGYNCILSVCPLWMSDKPATANGILLMGYAFSTAIFAPVINSLIVITDSVTFVFKILGILCGVGIVIFSFFIRIPDLRELEQLPQRDRNANKKEYNVITYDMIKMPLFWIYYILTILLPGVGLALINHNSPILTELGASSTFAAFIVSICAICNGVARFIFGFIFDKLGVSKSLIIITAIFVGAISIIFLGYMTTSISLYVLGACLLLVGFGCNATSMPSVLRELFGHRTFSLNYSVLGTDAFITAWFGTIVGAIQTGTGNYGVSLMVLAILTYVAVLFVGIFFALYKKEMKKRSN